MDYDSLESSAASGDSESLVTGTTSTTGTTDPRTGLFIDKELPPYPPCPPPYYNTTLLQGKRFSAYVNAVFPPGDIPNDLAPLGSKSITPNQTSPKFAKIINEQSKMLAKEAQLNTCFEWIRDGLFTDAVLPAPYEFDAVGKDSTLWENGPETFRNRLSGANEKGIASWLNSTAREIARVHGVTISPLRTFDPHTSYNPPNGGFLRCKPSTVVIDTALQRRLTVGDRLSWDQFHALLEVTTHTGTAAYNSVLNQLVINASLVFYTQPYRRHICGLGFMGTNKPTGPTFIFCLIDRSGVTVTRPSPISSYSALELGRIIFALRYAQPEALGLDTTMRVDHNYKMTEIDVHDEAIGAKTFKVVREIHYRPKNIFGRGTRVFVVRETDDGPLYVLKDSWPDASHTISEIDHLKEVQKQLDKPENSSYKEKLQHSCPQIYAGQEFPHKTSNLRGILLPRLPTPRVHRRIVVGPLGDPITTYRTCRELISCFIDIVNLLEFMEVKCGIVHGDISPSNLIIVRSPTPASDDDDCEPIEGVTEEIKSFGGLIDLDYSRKCGDSTHPASGTRPYMSIAALASTSAEKGGPFDHKGWYDLESLFYVLLFICLYTKPGGIFLSGLSVPMNSWFAHLRCSRDIALLKIANFLCMEREVLQHVSDCWKPFTPYLQQLRDAIWPNHLSVINHSGAMTYEAFRNILTNALQDDDFKNETPSLYASIPGHAQEEEAHLRSGPISDS